jgi:hypothetical protein
MEVAEIKDVDLSVYGSRENGRLDSSRFDCPNVAETSPHTPLRADDIC